jgi:hypothetical protein
VLLYVQRAVQCGCADSSGHAVQEMQVLNRRLVQLEETLAAERDSVVQLHESRAQLSAQIKDIKVSMNPFPLRRTIFPFPCRQVMGLYLQIDHDLFMRFQFSTMVKMHYIKVYCTKMSLMIHTFLIMAVQSGRGASQQGLIVPSNGSPQSEKFSFESTTVPVPCPVPLPAD